MRLSFERHSSRRQRSQTRAVSAHAGTAHVMSVVLVGLSLLLGGLYVFSVNHGAVQGYAMRSLETELKQLKKTNAELRVREAEATSLVRVEAGSVDLRMEKAEPERLIDAGTHAVASR